jgi:UDPglucose 6-dehydrogenase
MGIITAAEEANARQKRRLSDKVARHFGSTDLRGKVFGIWGMAFKPNTDDMREAPALTVVAELARQGVTFLAFDPVAMENAKKALGESAGAVTFCKSAYGALEGADALLIVTEWNEFRNPDFARIKKALRRPVIFDGRNLYQPDQMRKLGFTYYGIGRNP